MKKLAVAFMGALLVAGAMAAPLVDYTVTGTPGNYTLDFSVTNTLGPGQGLYFFGVKLGARDIVGSPTPFDPDKWPTWSNSDFGGSFDIYNNNWLDNNFVGFANGTTVSGFKVHVTDLSAPSSVPWFAYGAGTAYQGTDNFNTQLNPGFEGVASPAAVPEPMSMFAMGAGLVGLIARRKRK